MKTVEELVREFVPLANVMQLATTKDGQPWLCTVHFFSDDDLNFYWCSTTDRRHSKEIAYNPKAACYVLVHENTPNEDYVIGISVEGEAELVSGQEIEAVARGYVKKLGKDEATFESLVDGSKPFYRLAARSIVLFDNKDYADDPRQEWRVR